MMYMTQPMAVPAKDRSGSRQLLTYGPILEACPDDPNRAQLAQLERGSPFRLGRSYVAIGFDGPFVVPAAGAVDLNLRDQINEPGHLGVLYIAGVPAAATVAVTDLRRMNDVLLNGEVPAQMFAQDSFNSPVLGHFIAPNVPVQLEISNFGAAPITLRAGFTLI